MSPIQQMLLGVGGSVSVDNEGGVEFVSSGLGVGDGESLAIASDSSLNLGSGAFTLECWIKMNSSQGSAWNVLACTSGYLFGTGVHSFNVYVYGTAGIRIFDSSGGPGENWSLVFQDDSLFNNSSWTHFAWTRVSNGNNTSNNNNTVWINGTAQTSFSNKDNEYSDGQNLYIGASDYNQNGTATQYGFDGKISNFRLTKGQALYTDNFTPLTSPLTTTSQGATASNVIVLGCASTTSVTSFEKTPSTPTTQGTPTTVSASDGPFNVSNLWAKLSSVDADTKDSYVPTLSNNDLTAAAGNSSDWHHGRSTLGFTSGKYYWEVTASGNGMIGVEPISENIDREFYNAGTSGIATRDGKVWFGGSTVYNNASDDWSDGDTIGVAFDADTGTIYIYIDGTLSYSYDSNMSSTVFKKPSYSVYDSWTFTFNFGQSGFDQTPPTGYNAINTDNGAESWV